MSTQTVEEVRTLAQVRGELTKAQAEERSLIAEVQEVAAAAEVAIETGDTRAIKKIAVRRAELPLLLAAAVRSRARLAVEVAELELQEVEHERLEASRAVTPLREAERRAREEREEAEAAVGDFQSQAYGARDNLSRAREALESAQSLNPDDLVKRGK